MCCVYSLETVMDNKAADYHYNERQELVDRSCIDVMKRLVFMDTIYCMSYVVKAID